MKTTFILLVFILSGFMAFGQISYMSKPIAPNVTPYVAPMPSVPQMTPQQMQALYEYEQEINRLKKENFQTSHNLAIAAFNKKDYSAVTKYYGMAKSTGWYNSQFDFIAGVSYHKIGLKPQARKALKLASRRGYTAAATYLKSDFKK
jgi:hypothetical protein